MRVVEGSNARTNGGTRRAAAWWGVVNRQSVEDDVGSWWRQQATRRDFIFKEKLSTSSSASSVTGLSAFMAAASRSLQRDRELTGDSAGVSGRAGWANERATPALYWLPTAALPSGRGSALRDSMGTLRGAASASPPLRAAPSPRREWDFTASGKVNTKREAAQPLGGARPARDRSRAAISVAAHALAPARAYASLPLPSGGVRSTRLQSLISSNRELLLSLQRRGTVTALPVAQTRSANEEPVEEEELPWWGQEESPEAEPPVAVLRGSRRSSSAQAHPGRLSSAAALKLHGACEVRVRAARESGGEAS